jgi:hypothetical protein
MHNIMTAAASHFTLTCKRALGDLLMGQYCSNRTSGTIQAVRRLHSAAPDNQELNRPQVLGPAVDRQSQRRGVGTCNVIGSTYRAYGDWGRGICLLC